MIAWASLQPPVPTRLSSRLELWLWLGHCEVLRAFGGLRGLRGLRGYEGRGPACSVQCRAMCQHSGRIALSPAASRFSTGDTHRHVSPLGNFPLACILHSTRPWHDPADLSDLPYYQFPVSSTELFVLSLAHSNPNPSFPLGLLPNSVPLHIALITRSIRMYLHWAFALTHLPLSSSPSSIFIFYLLSSISSFIFHLSYSISSVSLSGVVPFS